MPNNDFNHDNQENIDSISHIENVKRISSSLKEDTLKSNIDLSNFNPLRRGVSKMMHNFVPMSILFKYILL